VVQIQRDEILSGLPRPQFGPRPMDSDVMRKKQVRQSVDPRSNVAVAKASIPEHDAVALGHCRGNAREQLSVVVSHRLTWYGRRRGLGGARHAPPVTLP